MKIVLNSIVALLLGFPAMASEPLENKLMVSYDAYYGGIYVGEVFDTVSVDGEGNYEIKSVVESRGIARLLLGGDVMRESSGVLDETLGLRSESYREKRASKPWQRASFDWATKKLSLSWGENESHDHELVEPAYDWLSFLYHFHVLGAVEAGLFRVTNGKRVSSYDYQAEGDWPDLMNTHAGDVKVFRLVRISGERRSELWVSADDGDMAPVHVEITTGAGTIIFKRSSIEGGLKLSGDEFGQDEAQ